MGLDTHEERNRASATIPRPHRDGRYPTPSAGRHDEYELHDPTTLTVDLLLIGEEAERRAAALYLRHLPNDYLRRTLVERLLLKIVKKIVKWPNKRIWTWYDENLKWVNHRSEET